MPENLSEKKEGLITKFKELWEPITAFVGVITVIISFIQLSKEYQATVLYFIAGGGLLVTLIGLFLIGFGSRTIQKKTRRSKKLIINKKVPRFKPLYRRFAQFGLIILGVFVILGSLRLINNHEVQENKLIVVIATFEGPEDIYGIRNEILESLNLNFIGDQDIEIIPIDKTITLLQGADYARKIGKDFIADVVIWGWYRPTENPNVTIHIENLAQEKLLPINNSITLQPIATLSELETFSFQQQVGLETSALVSFLAGFIDYRSGDNNSAIERFTMALITEDDTPRFLENLADIYFYRASSYLNLEEFQFAVEDYSKAIALKAQFVDAYTSRGMAYALSGDYQKAIQDFNLAIELNPKYSDAFIDRGNVYFILNENQLAINDFTQAININPESMMAYNNRGGIYAYLKDYQRAIQDLNRAIDIDPQFAIPFYNCGIVYSSLGKQQRSIQNFNRAIKIDPYFSLAYYQRGDVNSSLAKYDLAIQDYDRAIDLGLQYSGVFNNRGVVYNNFGNYQRSINDFNKAIELDPVNAEVYSNRCLTYFYLDNYEYAISDCTRAIEINPQLAIAYYNRGLNYQKFEKFLEAEADFAKYKELTGKDQP